MRISFCLVVMWVFILSGLAEARREHTVFFEGSDHELNVYRVYGKEKGKTILLIGGIQGDEPGGFLSADLYADMTLSKGNLIVVPRANFHSIVLNQRQVNEDMNRKFADDNRHNYETKVVGILKELIAESDCLLNLHDGSGFYSEKWESDQKNPNRYGQSIIADCERYETKDGKKIELGSVARDVIVKINRNIKDPDHYFHFNNHRTGSQDSVNKVQRKSATYYALVKCGIPAYGIESSKSLPLELKVRHHIYAINAFMEHFDVIPELPAMNLEPPELKYLVISVNNTLPIAVRNGQALSIKPGDEVNIMHIEANFDRGLSADVIGLGSVNDLRKNLVVEKPARITVRKDYYPCGSVYLVFNGGSENSSGNVSILEKNGSGSSFLMYKVMINGEEKIAENYSTVKVVRGDSLKLEDVISDTFDPSQLVVNFKGFVGNKSSNTGEDRGYKIKTSKDLWPNYSLNKKGLKYQVVTTGKHGIVGKLFIEIEPPTLDYLLVNSGGSIVQSLKSGQTINLKSYSDDGLSLVDVISNVLNRSEIRVNLTGPGNESRLLEVDKALHISCGTDDGGLRCYDSIRVMRGDLLMGSVSINYMEEMEQDEQIEKFVDN